MRHKGIIRKYRDFLPVNKDTRIITLHEGNTPLVGSRVLSVLTGNECNVYLKYEGLNPTASFKDRGMTMAVTKAVEEGKDTIICASTGNTSASASAYAARAGIKCIVLIPEGAIALGKLAQAVIHGAKVIQIKGNFDDALNIVKAISAEYPIQLVNSINPYRLEGQKTGAFEICDGLGRAPDYHIIPVGNAGNICAYWKGYKEYKERGRIDRLPKMIGFQAKGAAPIVENRIIKKPETIATAIRIGNPANWELALKTLKESDGLIETVTDEEILDAYKLLAREIGVFVEPASAASCAGLLKKAKEGFFPKGSTIVCIMTGHGLKDPDRAIGLVEKPVSVKAKTEDVLREIGY